MGEQAEKLGQINLMFQIYYIFEPFAKKIVSKYIELNNAFFQNLFFLIDYYLRFFCSVAENAGDKLQNPKSSFYLKCRN